MPSYLITGTSRGLGLGFVTELLKEKNNTVIATARNTAASTGLQELKKNHSDDRLILLNMDVSKEESIRSGVEAATKLLPNGLDNLINNAGVSYNGLKSFEDMNINDFTAEVNFNIVSALLVLRGFAPLVSKSETKRILVITSGLGSIQNAAYTPGLANGYSVSKAALNMTVRKYSASLKNQGITTALLHPGWVATTEMGQEILPWVDAAGADVPKLSLEQSCGDCMKVLHTLTSEDNGEFFTIDGTKVPW